MPGTGVRSKMGAALGRQLRDVGEALKSEPEQMVKSASGQISGKREESGVVEPAPEEQGRTSGSQQQKMQAPKQPSSQTQLLQKKRQADKAKREKLIEFYQSQLQQWKEEDKRREQVEQLREQQAQEEEGEKEQQEDIVQLRRKKEAMEAEKIRRAKTKVEAGMGRGKF